MKPRGLGLALSGALSGALLGALSAVPASGQAVDWSRIGGIFAASCTQCHSGDAAPLGLMLDSYENALMGGWYGPAMVAGDAANSRLLHRLRGTATPQMPLNGPPFLDEATITLIEGWIVAGMPRGDGPAPAPVAQRPIPAPGEPVVYADVEPIFQRRCIACHSDNSQLGAPPEGVRLDSYRAVLAGGERLVLVPGNVEMSEIWRRVTGVAQPRMPFDGPPWLSETELRLVTDWIAQGAPDTDGTPADMPVGDRVRLRGVLTAPDAIDDAAFLGDAGTRIDKSPLVGQNAEMRGVVLPDGQVRATRLRAR
ncbi:MAG: c-type cytochrome domain-containing protein [Paracoccaceae bacterium]